MKYLDNATDVVDWVYEPFFIKIDEGKRYIPDFLVTYNDGCRKLIEIKPMWMLNDENVVKKHDVAKGFCKNSNIEYMIYCLEDIEKMENMLVS